jgi:hypothetical protein
MNESKISPADAITAGLEQARLVEGDRSIVEFYLARDDESWRECCGSDCIPCMTQVAQAVDVARGLLERGGAR